MLLFFSKTLKPSKLSFHRSKGNCKSVRILFTSIIQYAEKSHEENPLWGFRKELIGKDFKSSIKESFFQFCQKYYIRILKNLHLCG